jgi:chorismate mutase
VKRKVSRLFCLLSLVIKKTKKEKIMKLEDWREEIDEIDSQIVGLLNRRAQAAQSVGVLKAQIGLPIVDIEREDEVLRKIKLRNAGNLDDDILVKLYRDIMQKSRLIQIETVRKMRSEKESAA